MGEEEESNYKSEDWKVKNGMDGCLNEGLKLDYYIATLQKIMFASSINYRGVNPFFILSFFSFSSSITIYWMERVSEIGRMLFVPIDFTWREKSQ